MRRERVFILDKGRLGRQIKMRCLTEGFEPYDFSDPETLIAQIDVLRPDLLLSTVDASSVNVVELCIRLREKTDAIIIMFNETFSDIDVISILSVGADFCTNAPFNMSVLIAQIHACFRRYKMTPPVNGKTNTIEYLVDTPTLKIDVKSRSVIVNYNPVDLTSREFDILVLLASHPNQVFYTNQIFQSVWDTDSILTGDDRTVSVHISNLRKKIELDPMHPKHIITVRGVGYKFTLGD